MENNQTDRSAWVAFNTLLNVISLIVPVLVSFWATRVLVREFGHEIYGLYMLIIGFLGYSFAFGIGKVAAKYVAEYNAAGKDEKIAQSVSAVLIVTLTIGIIGGGLLALTTPYLVADILNVSTDIRPIAERAFYIASIWGVAYMVSQVFQMVLQGISKFWLISLVLIVNSLLLNVGNVVLAINGFGIEPILVWNLVLVAANSLVFFFACKWYLLDLKFTFKIEPPIKKAVISYSMSLIGYQIAANALYIIERVWITRTLGAEAITYFAVTMVLAVYLHSIAGSFMQVTFPVFNEFLADAGRLKSIYQRSVKLLMSVTAPAVILSAAVGHVFLDVWIDPVFGENAYPLLIFHMLTFWVIIGYMGAWQVAETLEKARLNLVITLCWLVIAVVLMTILTGIYGLTGFAISRTIAVIMTFPMIFFIEKKCLGEILMGFWVKMMAKIVAAAIPAYFISYLIIIYLGSTWLSIIAAGAGGVSVYFGMLFIIKFFAPDEISMGRSIFGRVIGMAKR